MKMSDYTSPPRSDRVLRLKAAKCIAERKPHETMVSVAEKAGCNKASLYRWLDQEDFRDLVKTLTDDMLVEYMPQVDKAMVAKALEGSVGAAQYLAQRGGRTEIGTRDKGLEDFLKKLDEGDREALEFFQREGYWPEEGQLLTMPAPEREQ